MKHSPVLLTEAPSWYEHLERMAIKILLQNLNKEDKKVPVAVEKNIAAIEKLVKVIVPKMKKGGRLFYIGAGTSGRLGIVDASECPPTFGVPQGMVVAIMAGGDVAIRKAVEFAEDNEIQGWRDLKSHKISTKDVVVGIAASGTTPYVAGAIELCNKHNITTGGITCNPTSRLAKTAKYPIIIITGPEFVTGSTRLKAGTAQKLVLNMISTSVMIKLGRVKGNEMVDMQLTNTKLINRGTRMLMKKSNLTATAAKQALLQYGSVRKAIQKLKNK